MAFLDQQFPTLISFGAVGGPGFNTQVVTVVSGKEKRNAMWAEMRHAWEVSQAVKTNADFNAIRAFFLAAGGMLNAFRFKDWADFQALISEGVASALTTSTFQLQKKYVSASATTLRTISKPIASTFVLKHSGTTLTLTTDYTLDAATGIVTTTLTSYSAADLTWSGEFDTPARFGVDQLKANIVDRSQADGLLLRWESIPIIETRDIA